MTGDSRTRSLPTSFGRQVTSQRQSSPSAGFGASTAIRPCLSPRDPSKNFTLALAWGDLDREEAAAAQAAAMQRVAISPPQTRRQGSPGSFERLAESRCASLHSSN